FFHVRPPTPSATLFPYTTLFRSQRYNQADRIIRDAAKQDHIQIIHGDAIDKLQILAGSTFDVVLIDAAKGKYQRFFELSSPLVRSEEHTSELQSRFDIVCRLLLE